jgi:hypothetical protein
MKFTFVILLFLSLGADAQMIIKAHANYRPLQVNLTGVLLDDYPNAAGAYSLRKLRTAYTGNAIRVRRSNDNTEQDIGFTSAGDLDTASLKTFVGANSGFITTWYSQGDSSSVNFTQTTAANQPRIVNAGVVERRSGDPSIFFDGSNDFMSVASSTASFSYLHKTGGKAIFAAFQAGTSSDPNAVYTIIDNTNTASANTGYCLFYDDRLSFPRNNRISNLVTRGVTGGGTAAVDNLSNDNFFNANTLNLLSVLNDNNNATASLRSSLYANGANIQQNNTLTNTPSTTNASFNFTIGKRASNNDFYLLGYFSELIIYPSNQSSNRTGIENNINSYYVIY